MNDEHERRDDWRSGVDQNLVSLNTAQRVTDQQLDDLDIEYEAIDKVLRGDPETDTDGFIARLHNVENGLQEIRVALFKARMAEVEVTKSKWEFAGKIIERLLILAGLLFLGWDKVESLYHRIRHQPQSPLEAKIEKAKHRKGRPIVKIRVVPAAPPSDDTEESQPNPPK